MKLTKKDLEIIANNRWWNRKKIILAITGGTLAILWAALFLSISEDIIFYAIGIIGYFIIFLTEVFIVENKQSKFRKKFISDNQHLIHKEI